MKFLLVVIIMALFNSVLLQVGEPQKGNNISDIIIAVTGLVLAFGTIYNIYLTNRNRVESKAQSIENKAQLQEVAKGVDGLTTKLIETKTTEAHAMGVKQATDAMGKEEGIANKVRVEMMKEQQMKDQPSTKNQDTNIDVKNLEMEIRKKGDEIQKVVEKKGEDIQKGVDEVPDKTAEEVVKKLPPK